MFNIKTGLTGVSILLVLFVSGLAYAGPPGPPGQPFQILQAQLDELRADLVVAKRKIHHLKQRLAVVESNALLDLDGLLMRDHDDGAAEKLAALISGNKVAATEESPSQKDRKCLKEMEAGVGIEPAYTALQAAA